MAELDRQIDALYQARASDFTAARTALAKTLSGDAAKRVRALKKPTAVPWAVNQVFWRAKPVYERLMQRGKALRAAQIAALKGRAADVRAATEAHRTAIREATHQAVRFAAEAGVKPDAEHIARMLEAVSLAAAPPDNAGRFVDVVEPSGFEALTGVTPAKRSQTPTPASARFASPQQPPKPRAVDRAAERRQAAEENRRRRHAETALNVAARTLDRARERAAAAREALARAEAEVRTAERAVADRRAQLPK